jgi:hypothetical protein
MLMKREDETLPEDWTDADRANYYALCLDGEKLIGSVIAPNNKFLIQMSARMTIEQSKGKFSDLTNDEIERIKRANNTAFKQMVHHTPTDNEFYYSSNNPINKTDEELYEMNTKKPEQDDDIIQEDDPDNYLVQQVDKMLEIN